jgi:hypothetical protein
VSKGEKAEKLKAENRNSEKRYGWMEILEFQFSVFCFLFLRPEWIATKERKERKEGS